MHTKKSAKQSILKCTQRVFRLFQIDRINLTVIPYTLNQVPNFNEKIIEKSLISSQSLQNFVYEMINEIFYPIRNRETSEIILYDYNLIYDIQNV